MIFFHHLNVCVWVHSFDQFYWASYFRTNVFLGVRIDGSQDRLGPYSQGLPVYEKQFVLAFCLFAISGGEVQHLAGDKRLTPQDRMKTWLSALLKEINKCLVCEKVHKEGKRRPENARGHRCWQWFQGSAVAQEVLGAWIVSRTAVGDRAVSDQPGSSPGCPTFRGRT